MLTKEQLCRMMDHTNANPWATNEDIEKLCNECRKYNFAMAATTSAQAARVHELLAGTDVHTGGAVAFPFGQMTIEAKAFETMDDILNGADEVDYVINITEMKAHHYDYIKKEMQTITDICHKYGRLVKVIFETCYLTKDEIIDLCKIANEVNPDFCKTSTGFGKEGAKVEDVKLMRENLSKRIKVKASGGIRTIDQALAMIKAGAERIGTSHAVEIVEQYKG